MTSVPTYVWMSQFHGCRLERNVGVKIIGKFRAEAAAELRKMNQKAVASRKKHNEKRKRQEEVFSDDDAVNHFSMEKTKLWNNSTCKMNIAPKVPTSAERIHDEVKGRLGRPPLPLIKSSKPTTAAPDKCPILLWNKHCPSTWMTLTSAAAMRSDPLSSKRSFTM